MTVTVTTFDPTSKIKNGKDGLANSPASKSHVRITGTNLENGLDVNVYDPPGSTLVWTGKTYGTNPQKTRCRAKLNNESTVAPAPGRMKDGDTQVSVTVGDSASQNFNVLTGPPLSGSYSVACNGTGGGSYKWLAPNGTTGVNLSNASNAASAWVFTMLNNQQGNCYTIQCEIGGTAYYLQWANSGTGTVVSLVTATGAGTAWLLDSDCIKAFDVPSYDPATPNCTFLNGDTTSGAVNILAQADPNHGTSWSLGTYGSPRRA
jgi:hypothetical protein